MKKKILLLVLLTLLLIPATVMANTEEKTSRSNDAPSIQIGAELEPRTDTTFPAGDFTGGMNVTAYSSPDSSFDVTLSYLRSAKNSIDIEIYAISNGFLLHELNQAYQRNNNIKIKVVASWISSGFEKSDTRAALYNISQIPLDYESQTNIQLYWTDDSPYERTHAKFIIIDEEVVLIQSANWAKTGIPPSPTTGNREWGVAVKNQNVVDYYLEIFGYDLINSKLYTPNPDDFKDFSASISTGSYTHPFSEETFIGTMRIRTIVTPDNAIPTIIELLESASDTLDVQQMYIRIDWHEGYEDLFMEELVDAAQRGVDVRVILDQKYNKEENLETANYLDSFGIEVKFGDTTKLDAIHNKGVIVDEKAVLVSSINWSNESVTENRETGIIIYDSDVANYFTNIFEWDWAAGEIPEGLPEFTGLQIMFPLIALTIALLTTIKLRKKQVKTG
ncbi:MAG: phospholipase D-like domain-containing protein [Candidatus Wukongarchaeota archaeon]|nr:phospholipase D-like domain-containing protein [Candidatus Wukongarchaeota archaeon]MDO8128552.1 phospholipase D-like domain-containing protein [Candidatus Wukongarchaeota archaeon]